MNILGALHFVKFSIFKFVALSEISQKGIEIFSNSPPLQALFWKLAIFFLHVLWKCSFSFLSLTQLKTRGSLCFFNTLPASQLRQSCWKKKNCSSLKALVNIFAQEYDGYYYLVGGTTEILKNIWLLFLDLVCFIQIHGLRVYWYDARSWLMSFLTIKSGNLFCTGPAIAYFPCDIRYWKAHQLRQEESDLWCRVVYNTIAWNCMILTLFHHSISEMKWTNDERMYRITRLSLQPALLPKSSDVWCRLVSGASSGCRDSIVILFCRENYGF